MRGFPRRWSSDSVPAARSLSAGSSPRRSMDVAPIATSSNADAEEFVEVTLDFQDDDTVILRSVEPATAADRDAAADPSRSASSSRSPSMGRSSSHRLRQFSQELKAEAVAKAKQLTQDLKLELKRFSWSSRGGASAGSNSAATSAIESALAARALRKQRAQLDRTRSGAQKAIRGLRFISRTKSNGVDAWNEVQANFDKLARDGFLSRSDFAQCIGFFFPSKNFGSLLLDVNLLT